MKKLRSKLLRRKRSNFSPILKPYVAPKLNSSSIIDSFSNLTRDFLLSCGSTSRVSSNNKSVKKRGFGDGNGADADVFHRITRSYSKQMEIMTEKDFELSVASWCVEWLNSSSKNLIQKGSEESANKEFQKETMFLGVGLLDRFFSKGYFRNKRELETAGIACLTLATRIEENQPFNSIRQKFFHIGNNEYSRSEVVAMEWLVQEVLNFRGFLPTIYNFLWFYLKAVRADEDINKTAKYLAVLALMGHEQMCYWPSTVAASLVILACLGDNEQSTNQQTAWIYDGSNDKDLPNCIKFLEWKVK